MSNRHSIRAVPPSPTTDVHISTWQFETSAGAPQLGFKDFKDSPLTMDNPYFARGSPNTTLSSSSNLLTTRSRPSSAGANEAPSSPSPLPHPRDVSNILHSPFSRKLSNTSYTHTSQSNYTLTSLLTPTRLPLSPQSSPPQSSSSAVSPSENTNDGGYHHTTASNTVRATPLGKSGRVIERLMADIDRLKRDLLIETTRRQELESRDEATKDTLARLQTEVGHLERARDTETTALGRRDRKIEEMRVEVEREKQRRERAEEEAREAVRIADERVSEAEEVRRRACDKADRVDQEMMVLQKEHMSMEAEYRRRTEALEKVFGQVLEEKEEERAKVQRLDVVLEQMGQEIERANKVNAKMGVAFDQYKMVKEEEVAVLKEKMKGLEELDGVTREETLKVLDEARWLVTLNKKQHAAEKEKNHETTADQQDTAAWQEFWKKS